MINIIGQYILCCVELSIHAEPGARFGVRLALQLIWLIYVVSVFVTEYIIRIDATIVWRAHKQARSRSACSIRSRRGGGLWVWAGRPPYKQ